MQMYFRFYDGLSLKLVHEHMYDLLQNDNFKWISIISYVDTLNTVLFPKFTIINIFLVGSCRLVHLGVVIL